MTLKLSWHALCFSTHGLWKQLLTYQQLSGCSLIPLLCPFMRCPYPNQHPEYASSKLCFDLIPLYFCMYAIVLPVESCCLSLQLQFVTYMRFGLDCEARLMLADCAFLRSRCCWTFNTASSVQMDVQPTSMCMYVTAWSAGLIIMHTIKNEYHDVIIRAHSYIAFCAVSAALKHVYRVEAGYQRFLADSTCSSSIVAYIVQIARAFRRKKLMAEVMGGGKSRQQLLNRHADRSVHCQSHPY